MAPATAAAVRRAASRPCTESASAKTPSSIATRPSSATLRSALSDQPMPSPVISPRRVSPKQMNAANANGTHGWMGFAPGWVFCRSRASVCAMTRITIGPNP